MARAREFLREEYQRAFRHDHWHVGIVDAPIHAFLEPDANLEARWLPPPDRGKYLADPFGVGDGDSIDILMEEFDFRTNKGVIAWARADAGGRVSRPRAVLEVPSHMSYPFLIERSGTIFCVPETSQEREVSLFQATEFPVRWSKVATLLPGVPGADNTIVRHGGRFWLFNTDMDDGPYSKLRIWHAADLFGPWAPHAQNPVKRDLGSARPGGTPFVWRGDLYRPSQDSSKTYGGSVVINRVVRLTSTEYREEPAAIVGPLRGGPHQHGIHTLSAVGDRTLVDSKRMGFNKWAMVRSLSRRWPWRVLGPSGRSAG